jgi:hypothetical protein
MKNIVKKMVLLVALCVLTIAAGYAQEPSKVGIKVNEIVKEYENVKDVDCLVATKGSGLGLLKMMLNQQFGKDFMKGVTSITIINYSDAAQEVCLALRKELDVFETLLEEFDMDEEKELATNEFIRCFASISKEDKTISDFVFAAEDNESKMLMYMAGKIRVE